MRKYLEIALMEKPHLNRSPFKIIAIVFYVIAVIYGCQNGYNLFTKQNKEIMSIQSKYEEFIEKMLVQYEEIENGTIEKPRRAPSIPYWAIWNAPSYALNITGNLLSLNFSTFSFQQWYPDK